MVAPHTGAIMDAMDKRRRLEELLKPGGKILGSRPRQRTMVRRVISASPAEEARWLFKQLADLGHEVPVEEPTRGSRPGRLAEIPGLGHVGYRDTPTPTVDVNVSIEGLRNVKFKFVREDRGAGT